MNFSILPKLDVEALVSIIKSARNAEPTRDLNLMHESFIDVWNDLKTDPNFDSFLLPYRAELYRYVGFFLSHYGKMRNLKDFQERGKNLLTKAIDLFNENELPEKAREAQIMLALCYYYEGGVNESTDCLDEIIEEYSVNPLHPVYLQAVINKSFVLAWQSKVEPAEKLLDSIKESIELTENHHLLSMYHNHFGMICRRLEKFNKGVFHYHEALRHSKINRNTFFYAANLNNLGNLYRQTGKFPQAHEKIDEAIQIFTEENIISGIAQCLDTKANTFYDDGKNRIALRTINEALEIFERGEDSVALVESLMTKVRCLLRLGYKSQAIYEFTRLSKIAETKISAETLQRYTKEYQSFFYIKKGLPLVEEIKNFRKEEVNAALREAKNNISKASRILRLKSNQHLDEILLANPDICEENGLEPRKRIKNKPKELNREIKKITLGLVKPNFDNLYFPLERDAPVYYFSKSVIRSINEKLDFDALVVLKNFEKIGVGRLALAKRPYNSSFYVGTIGFEHDLGFYSLHVKDNPVPFILSDLRLIGEPVGFCEFNCEEESELIFKPFE